MANETTRVFTPFSMASLDRGYRHCNNAMKSQFGNFTWVISNLPREQRMAVAAVANHLVKAIDYLDLESADGLALDVWCEFRDDLSDAFADRYTSIDLMPLVRAARNYRIPKQYFFDVLNGVDHWIRNRRFDSFDELAVFASRIGGSSLAAVVPICGFLQPGFESAALKAGQAIFLTQILANLYNDIKLNRVFIARPDLDETEISLSRIKVRQATPELKYLIRLYGSRIEKLMVEGGRLIQFLDFDARRSFKSLMATYWQMLMNMRLNPAIVLNPDGVLSRRERFKLKTRHFLGTEGNVSVIPEISDHH